MIKKSIDVPQKQAPLENIKKSSLVEGIKRNKAIIKNKTTGHAFHMHTFYADKDIYQRVINNYTNIIFQNGNLQEHT